MNTKAFVPVFLLVAALAQSAIAKVKTETIEYKQGDTTLEGLVAYDDASEKPRPGVLLIHDWMGVSDYAKSRAEQVAALGYVVFAPDIYGKGVRPADAKEASSLAGQYKA